MKQPLSNPESWVDEHGDYLFRYAMSRMRDRSLAEEAVQEAFLAALRSKDSFSGQSTERTWLTGILKHKIIDHYRKTSRELPLLEEQLSYEKEETFRSSGEWVGHWTSEAAPAEWGANPEFKLQQKEFYEILDQCLSLLPQRLARAFILREIEEMSSNEICNILNISESNLWVMLHRARGQLRRSLETMYFHRESSQI
jgi:RNA polymerase sigma-70 factor (TIGR02943 family)